MAVARVEPTADDAALDATRSAFDRSTRKGLEAQRLAGFREGATGYYAGTRVRIVKAYLESLEVEVLEGGNAGKRWWVSYADLDLDEPVRKMSERQRAHRLEKIRDLCNQFAEEMYRAFTVAAPLYNDPLSWRGEGVQVDVDAIMLRMTRKLDQLGAARDKPEDASWYAAQLAAFALIIWDRALIAMGDEDAIADLEAL